MATYTKQLLSASVDGKQIVVFSTGTATANAVHTPPAGTTSLDEVYIYGHNPGGSSAYLTILWGGTTSSDSVTASITGLAGRTLIVDGKLAQNSIPITAYVSAGTVLLDGFVNRIS